MSDTAASAAHHAEHVDAGKKLEDFLGKRPTKEELVDRHILLDSKADPSLVAKQKELEQHRLADKLDNALKKRPTAEELVQKHILNADEAPGH